MNPHVFPGTLCVVWLLRRPILGEPEYAPYRRRTGTQITRAVSRRFAQQLGEPRHLDSTRIRVGFDRRTRMTVARQIEFDALQASSHLAFLLVRPERNARRS